MPVPRRVTVPGAALPLGPAVLAALVLLLLLVGAALPGAARAEPAPTGPGTTPPRPVGLVLATSGLGWEDVTAEDTPALQCLADRSGVGAMNTTSTTVVSTHRQGMETLRTGYRGLAEEAPRSAGIPRPATDQWARVDVPVRELTVDAPDAAALDELGPALARGELVLVDLGGLPAVGDDARPAALRDLDARVGTVLDAAGGCDAADLPRTLLVSVAAVDPGDPGGVEETGAVASRTVGLQVAMDSSVPGTALTSGSTKQAGILALTDVLPTVLASHGATASGLVPGQPLVGEPEEDPQGLALDRSLAAALVDGATVPALAVWMAPGVVGVLVLLVPPLARRPRLAAVARAAATVAPLALPAGLVASAVPWWRADHPTLALTATVCGGAALLAAVTLLGPWRRHRLGPPGVAAALVAGVLLLESATGSHLQVSSPLGAQPISGGRFYGLSNHLYGLVAGSALLALLCLLAVLRTPRARVLATLGVGVVVAVVCVAPSMGADFGSMLATVPTFGLLALLVSGIRLRVWHVLALGVSGAALVLGVSFLDWLRPAEDRTHLGRFIDELLSGELLAVIVRKLAQNVAMTTGYPALGLLLLLAVVASVGLLAPRRVRWHRLAALDLAHPSAYRVRVALVAGTWLGYAVNDTGPVLVAAVVGIWLALLPPVLPDPAPADA